MNQVVGNGIGVPKAPGIAIASLVLGIFGVFLACLTGIPAVICGHMALSRIGKSNGALGGRGLAITGTVLGYVGIVWTLALIPALTVPYFSAQLDQATEARLVSNARQVFMGCKLYALDHDGVLPERLEQLTEEMILEDGSIFLVPGEVEMSRTEEMMFRIVAPGAKELELGPGAPLIVSRMPVSLREDAGWVLVTADGAARVVKREEIEALGVELE